MSTGRKISSFVSGESINEVSINEVARPAKEKGVTAPGTGASVGGWETHGALNDLFQRDEPLLFARLKQTGVDARLVIYNGRHFPNFVTSHIGDAQVPPNRRS